MVVVGVHPEDVVTQQLLPLNSPASILYFRLPPSIKVISPVAKAAPHTNRQITNIKATRFIANLPEVELPS
jgi:hypothetical protein